MGAAKHVKRVNREVPASARRSDALVLDCGYSGFMQSSAWRAVKQAEGFTVEHFVVQSGKRIEASCLCLLSSSNSGIPYFYSPMGPALNWHAENAAPVFVQLLSMIKEVAKQNKVAWWRFEPWLLQMSATYLPEQAYKSPQDLQPRHTAVVPLIGHTNDSLLDSLHQKQRYNIRLAQKKGITTTLEVTPEAIHTFYEVYSKTVDRKELEAKPLSYFLSIQKSQNKHCFPLVVTAWYQSQPIASLFLIASGERLTYFFGGFDYQYRTLMSPALCHYRAMCWAMQKDIALYDLWGIADTGDPSHPWAAITGFKLKFNPVKLSLVGAQDIIFNTEKYEQYLQLDLE
jgi:peptidoglycan pentaglycine glycine transferase (the first glycine)